MLLEGEVDTRSHTCSGYVNVVFGSVSNLQVQCNIYTVSSIYI